MVLEIDRKCPIKSNNEYELSLFNWGQLMSMCISDTRRRRRRTVPKSFSATSLLQRVSSTSSSGDASSYVSSVNSNQSVHTVPKPSGIMSLYHYLYGDKSSDLGLVHSSYLIDQSSRTVLSIDASISQSYDSVISGITSAQIPGKD